ncbi:hypothetical protein L6452_04835 [Arctium lappa]|uniref:Uncharacterized protein n=1 Tax=Arctium lappa TaxID=4217 RepID=A0ACB9EFT8_ARCLA|nr:hypothetical protein L6452_04835 [Arctium lappa]
MWSFLIPVNISGAHSTLVLWSMAPKVVLCQKWNTFDASKMGMAMLKLNRSFLMVINGLSGVHCHNCVAESMEMHIWNGTRLSWPNGGYCYSIGPQRKGIQIIEVKHNPHHRQTQTTPCICSCILLCKSGRDHMENHEQELKGCTLIQSQP